MLVLFVLRIEHPETGTGPYSYEVYNLLDEADFELLEGIIAWHNEETGHPGMRDMSPVFEEQDTYYGVELWEFHSGFESKEQARRWFQREDLETLMDLGFHLRAYETKGAVLKDGVQVAFRKAKSKLLVENDWSLIGIS